MTKRKILHIVVIVIIVVTIFIVPFVLSAFGIHLFEKISDIFSSLLTTCGINTKANFSDIEIGENFGHNRDGHCKKLPKNYCLNIDLSEGSSLIKVLAEQENIPFFENSVYNNPKIIEGHFIKGWFDNSQLLLCEEIEQNHYRYVVYMFDTKEIKIYDTLESIELPIVNSEIPWFTLCNTFEEQEY